MPLGNSSFRTSFNIIVLQTCRPPRSSDRRRLAFCPPLPLPLLPRGLPQTADVRKRGIPWDAVCDRGSPSRTVSGNWLTGRTPSCVTDAPHTPPAARVTYGASKLDIEKKKYKKYRKGLLRVLSPRDCSDQRHHTTCRTVQTVSYERVKVSRVRKLFIAITTRLFYTSTPHAA